MRSIRVAALMRVFVLSAFTSSMLTLAMSALTILASLFGHPCLAEDDSAQMRAKEQRAVSNAAEHYKRAFNNKLKPYLDMRLADFPPEKIALLAVKESQQLELWGWGNGRWISIKKYPVLATSGVLGPKLAEGDKQIPEGIYRIIKLNPYSNYHLSMKLNYPNRFDLKWAGKEGRDKPGGNIFIHGKDESIGCLAIGDRAIEELFVLVHKVGLYNVKVIISPTDPRISALEPPEGSKPWVEELYKNITSEFLAISGK